MRDPTSVQSKHCNEFSAVEAGCELLLINSKLLHGGSDGHI